MQQARLARFASALALLLALLSGTFGGACSVYGSELVDGGAPPIAVPSGGTSPAGAAGDGAIAGAPSGAGGSATSGGESDGGGGGMGGDAGAAAATDIVTGFEDIASLAPFAFAFKGDTVVAQTGQLPAGWAGNCWELEATGSVNLALFEGEFSALSLVNASGAPSVQLYNFEAIATFGGRVEATVEYRADANGTQAAGLFKISDGDLGESTSLILQPTDGRWKSLTQTFDFSPDVVSLHLLLQSYLPESTLYIRTLSNPEGSQWCLEPRRLLVCYLTRGRRVRPLFSVYNELLDRLRCPLLW